MNRILIVGATSAIAEAAARLFAAEGDWLFLAARNADKLQVVADDLKVRGAGRVATAPLDALDYDCQPALLEAAEAALEGLDVVLVAHGTLPDQKACEASFAAARGAFEVNALSVISLLTSIANRFEARGQGTIAVISSVAGDRGRQSNYVYGAAKGCVDVFLQGLAHRLAGAGVRVLTVKPGFVDTPMTAQFKKGVLWTSPERVARDIHRAIARRRAGVLYTPAFWRWIMLLIRLLPAWVIHRTRL
jgi:decaprenylphospho-beta-D-erythro-pentofuranosid-2-ulose 2-reductase